jgi:hypothetical protein
MVRHHAPALEHSRVQAQVELAAAGNGVGGAVRLRHDRAIEQRSGVHEKRTKTPTTSLSR